MSRSRRPEPLRLNLGSGPSKYVGFKSVDFDPKNDPDVLHDLNEPLPFPDDSVDEVFASHVIEHFPLHAIQRILQDWCRVLKPKTGLLWGFVPDAVRVAQVFLDAVAANDRHTKLVMVTNWCGGYTNNAYIGEGQTHYYAYDADTLRETLGMGGFNPVTIIAQEAGPLDYRLVFACGKGVYAPMDIEGLGVKVEAPWIRAEKRS